MGTEDRHVSFEDPHSSASDEDAKAVEVTFDAANVHRRKSSLVPSESQRPRPREDDKTQCLVHQFLESQRRARHAQQQQQQQHGTSNSNSSDKTSADHHDQPPPPPQVHANTVINGSSAHENGLGDRLVEPKGNDVGQTDEHNWAKQMAKATPSEVDQAGLDPDVLHSRLLTKKQLSEMAWGVRELSRRLGSMRLKFRVRNIFILTKIYDRDLVPKTRELVRWLLDKDRDVRYTVYLERELKTNKQFDAPGLVEEIRKDYVQAGELEEENSESISRRLRWWDERMCHTRPHTFDFAITLGGDGTVLYASWLFQRIVPPVLSFALGSLGFLTKFDFEDYRNTLTGAFKEGVTVSLRLRFEGTIMRSQKRRRKQAMITDGKTVGEADGQTQADEEVPQAERDLVEELIGEERENEHTHKPDGTYEILNEIVVDRGPNPTMSFCEIFGDDEHFTSVLADGVCVSTPTGSTAYNLAAGGSLCHPENPVMLVTAICAHTLNFRPIILPDTIVLRVGVPYSARTSSWASFDGRERLELLPGDYVTISASRYPFASVQAQGRRSEDWVNSISGKLGWNTRQKQKAFREWDH
ncbi:ATP-NAD kinase [Cryphonectria parasitica EP155]|uniref:ATP-NAD kinase n=1 Tax=Cryphonectria parasitica (strain ATCC 38755 / EP155) TaxID=660469 RepID=A0A9P5CTM5_CRYP1|nr:ATP-NAD kinase [Cryphonectria parasitica EP155]KAF3770794.1 ATP-NAD kinase [Cryphonectria parasitica EP155]